MKRLLTFLSAIGAFALPATAAAQAFDATIPYAGAVFTGPHFFIAVIAGLVLALAFQFVLTNISVAAGISSLQFYPRSSSGDDSSDDGMDVTPKKIAAGMGIWALLTASIALFFATWLAVELAIVPTLLMSVVLGLVIWALFYLVIVVFEATAMASLVGTLVATALGGLKAAYNTTTSIFSRSPEDQVADMATEATKAVEAELARDFDTHRVREVLDGYVDKISKPAFKPEDVRKEVEKLLSKTELRSVALAEGPAAFEIDSMLTEIETHGKFDEQSRRAIREGISGAIDTVKRERRSPKGDVESAIDGALQLVGMERREAEQTRRKLEQYLRNTGAPELQPNDIKRDLAALVREPSAGREAVAARLRAIDSETVTQLIAQRKDISRSEAERIVDGVMNAVSSLQAQVSQGSDEFTARSEKARQMVENAQNQFRSGIRNFIERIDDPALDYDGLERDMHRIFNGGDTREGLESMMQRVRAMDRDSIVEVVSAHPRVEQSQAERVVQAIERARDKTESKLTELKLKAERKVKEAKIAARKRAEDTRELAASAAWWAVASAVASGFAAALGGIVATSTGI